MRNNRVFLLFVFSVLFFCMQRSSLVSAQDIMGGSNPIEEYEEERAAEKLKNQEASDVREKIIFGNTVYYRPSYATMSKIYWLYDFPDINNNDDIDIFLQINECELYRRYYENELEWLSIRDLMRNHLRENKDKFPRELFFDMEINFGRYDTENGVFPVTDDHFVKGLRHFSPFSNSLGWKQDYCNLSKWTEFKAYPRDILFIFKRPLIIQRVPVDKVGAEKIIRQWNSARGEISRSLFLRVYVSIKKYEGRKSSATQHLKDTPVFSSNVDGYEIFTDLTFADPIYVKNLTRRE